MAPHDDDPYVITGLADDYHSRLFAEIPGENGFVTFKRRNYYWSVVTALAAQRERARFHWVADHGLDPVAWPLPHPSVVLRAADFVAAACLRCEFLRLPRAERSDPTVLSVRTAASHAAEWGGDAAWLSAHPPLVWWGHNLSVPAGSITFEHGPLPHDPYVMSWWGVCRACGGRGVLEGLSRAGIADVWSEGIARQWVVDHVCGG